MKDLNLHAARLKSLKNEFSTRIDVEKILETMTKIKNTQAETMTALHLMQNDRKERESRRPLPQPNPVPVSPSPSHEQRSHVKLACFNIL